MLKVFLLSFIILFSQGLNAGSSWQEVSSTSAITIAQTIHTAPSKGLPQDSDEIGIADSNSSYLFKKINISSLKTFLFGSPVLTGTPTAPTAVNGTNTNQIATTSYVMSNSGSGVGVGQSWQDMIGSRVSGTTYTNDTGKPITVFFSNNYSSNYYINGVLFGRSAAGGDASVTTFVVPNGNTYKIVGTFGAGYVLWFELR